MHGLVSLIVHAALPSLSQLADLYRTDKSAKHGHSYVGLYGMLLDPIRKDVRNVTEIGILAGSSLLMWADYFDRAQIWGMDISSSQLRHAIEQQKMKESTCVKSMQECQIRPNALT
jgi:hypothetical protein